MCPFLRELYFEVPHQNFLKFSTEHLGTSAEVLVGLTAVEKHN